MNLDAVLEACTVLPGSDHNRRTAISTVGWIPGIERLTDPAPDPPALRARRDSAAQRADGGQRALPAR